MCLNISEKTKGTLFIGIHNPTKGLPRDFIRTIGEKIGIETSAVERAKQFFMVLADSISRVNPNALWLHIAHSEGGVITNRAIERVGERRQEILQKQLYVFSVGPAEPIPMDYGAKCISVYSEKDYVTGFFGKPFRNDPRYDIQFLKCISPSNEKNFYIADHRFLGPTYAKAWSSYIKYLQETNGFYDMENR